MDKRKSKVLNMNDDLYYFSSEDSEDELDRIASKSKLNMIQSNIIQTLESSPIFSRNKSININKSINTIDNDFSFRSTKNISKSLKKSKSDIRAIKLFKYKQKIKHVLNCFTYGHNREKYLEMRQETNYPKIREDNQKYQKVDWKLFYEIIFLENKKTNKESSFNKTHTNLSEFIFDKEINDQKENKFDNMIEKFRFKIIIDKIKYRMKQKYELVEEEDIEISNTNRNKKKKMNKLPEILVTMNQNKNNNMKNVYKLGISEIDKNRYLPMVINKLKKKFDLYLDKNKYEIRQYFQSLRNNSSDLSKNKSENKIKKKKKIKFEDTNTNTNKILKSKYSIVDENVPFIFKNNSNIIIDKRKKNSNNYKNIKSFKKVEKTTTLLLKHRKTLQLNRKKDYDIEIKSKSDTNLNNIIFNEIELNNVNNKKIYMTDDKLEIFKNNAKTLINDEILLKEIRRKYPDYEEEFFNLYNNYLLYEKIYEKQELKNIINMKKYKDYNHNINNFLSLKNKINLPINKKYSINNKILESAVNIQKVINYLK